MLRTALTVYTPSRERNLGTKSSRKPVNTCVVRLCFLLTLQRFVGLMRVVSHPTSTQYATLRCVHGEHIRFDSKTFSLTVGYSLINQAHVATISP